ncbi:MAG: hypothetical protein WDO15_06550 [Bacteroidota bacterium]
MGFFVYPHHETTMKNSPDRRAAVIALLVLFSCFLSSCTKLAVQGVQKQTDLAYVVPAAEMYADEKFTGIGEFINKPGDEANIVLIHGLTTKLPDHFDFMVQRLAYKLSLKLTASKVEVPIVQDATFEDRVVKLGACQLFKWEFQTRSNPSKKVNIYFIYWGASVPAV